MTRETLRRAIEEATRFLQLTTLAMEDLENLRVRTKNTGALRRASLDLTRVLADMRKSPS